MKIIHFRLRKAPLIAAGAAFLLVLGLIIGSVSSVRSAEAAALGEGSVRHTPKTVLIDPGHGGEDGGTASEDGTLEKEINLKVALYLRDLLRLSGFNVKMTREEDIDLGDKTLKSVRERKISDLKTRAKMISDNSGGILLSIHQNYFEQPKYSGTQIFYSSNNAESMPIAESIRKEIVSLLQTENTRELKDATSVYILKNASCPAVIVECGFLSNPEEAAKLSDDKYQKELAFAICCGLIDHYS